MWAGDDFATAKAALLQAAGRKARSHPCPRECGCRHRVVEDGDGRIVAVCQCEPWNCNDFRLSEADLVVYELSWGKLGRAVAKAFGCEPRADAVGLPGTRQVAALGGKSLPVFLTVQLEAQDLRSVAGQLAARQRGGFILLAPTRRFMDASTRELLDRANAGFFDLESHLELLESGRLHAPVSGGELFKAHLPEKKEAIRESEAARVFRLFGGLLEMGAGLKAPPAQVFDLLVFKKKSKAETAAACKCVASLITRRVAAIEEHFNLPIERLRAFASDLKERHRTVKGDRYARKKRGALDDEAQQYEDEDRPGKQEDENGYLPEERPDYG